MDLQTENKWYDMVWYDMREATGVYWKWKSTQVLSPWKQDQNDGDDDDDDDDDDDEFKVHAPSVT